MAITCSPSSLCMFAQKPCKYISLFAFHYLLAPNIPNQSPYRIFNFSTPVLNWDAPPLFFFSLRGSLCSNTDLESLLTPRLRFLGPPAAPSDRVIVMLSHTRVRRWVTRTHHPWPEKRKKDGKQLEASLRRGRAKRRSRRDGGFAEHACSGI